MEAPKPDKVLYESGNVTITSTRIILRENGGYTVLAISNLVEVDVRQNRVSGPVNVFVVIAGVVMAVAIVATAAAIISTVRGQTSGTPTFAYWIVACILWVFVLGIYAFGEWFSERGILSKSQYWLYLETVDGKTRRLSSSHEDLIQMANAVSKAMTTNRRT